MVRIVKLQETKKSQRETKSRKLEKSTIKMRKRVAEREGKVGEREGRVGEREGRVGEREGRVGEREGRGGREGGEGGRTVGTEGGRERGESNYGENMESENSSRNDITSNDDLKPLLGQPLRSGVHTSPILLVPEGGEREEEGRLNVGERTESRNSSMNDIDINASIDDLRLPVDRPFGSRDPTPPILLAPEDDDRLTGDAVTGFRAVGGQHEAGPGSHDLGMVSHDIKTGEELGSPASSPMHSGVIHDGFIFAIHRKTVSGYNF